MPGAGQLFQTFILQADVFPSVYEPLFKDHLLKPVHHSTMFNTAANSYWPPVVLFLTLCAVVLLKVTAPVKTLRVLNAAYSLQVARQIEREDYSPFKRVSVVLSIVFVLTIGFLFFRLNQVYGSVLRYNSSFMQYVFFVIVVAGVYTVKFITINLISFITEAPGLCSEYINNTLIINQAIGLLLFPVIVLLQLSPVDASWLLFPGVLFLVMGYLLRLYRGFVFAGIESGVGLFQLFVYLCALEILPLLVLIKFLVVKF